MGSQGVDIQLSEQALRLFPFGVECKNRARIAVYGDFQQAMENAGKAMPLLVIKQNHSEPLAITRLEDFMELTRLANQSRNRNT